MDELMIGALRRVRKCSVRGRGLHIESNKGRNWKYELAQLADMGLIEANREGYLRLTIKGCEALEALEAFEY